ncbi:branched-chain amino acid ABC transporter permease [Thermodesulfobacteriota bacterium]
MTFSDQILQFVISGISTGSIYAIVGLGFMIIYSVTRVVNFAQGEFVMLGGMLSATFYAADFSLGFAVLLAAALTGVIGIVLYQTVIYPIRGAPAFALILVTFGVSIIIRGIAMLIWGTDPMRIPYFSRAEPIPISGALLNAQSLWIIISTAVIALCLFLFFRFTVAGKAFMASAISAFLAGLMGIKPERMGLLAFGISAALAAYAGAVMGPLIFPHVGIGLHLSVKGFTAALIGGLNRIEGVIVGGLALGVLEALSAGLVSSGSKDAIALSILLVVLAFRHHGLLGDEEAGQV